MRRTYRLAVSGIISFGDSDYPEVDKEVENRLLSGQYNSKDKEAIEIAVRELQEEATDLIISMVGIK